jgi:glyoxylase-like metal-dependent hydrolase (beta-lactamase superfamily II)
LTHIHIDHAGGVGMAIKEMGNAMVLAHSRARSHLIDPTVLWESSLKTLGDIAVGYGKIDPVPENRILEACDEMTVELGSGIELEVYLTPGHAKHHLSLFDKASSILLAGEAAGVCTDGAVKPGTPPPFKLCDALSSIDRLIKLAPQKICYAHFGCYGNGLHRLKIYREQLLSWYRIIRSATDVGKNVREIIKLLRDQDSNLAYIDLLDGEEYAQEMELLESHVHGLAASMQRS